MPLKLFRLIPQAARYRACMWLLLFHGSAAFHILSASSASLREKIVIVHRASVNCASVNRLATRPFNTCQNVLMDENADNPIELLHNFAT